MGYKTRRRWGSFIVKQIHDWKTEDALSHGKRRPFNAQLILEKEEKSKLV